MKSILFALLLIFTTNINSQDFESKVLVDIPGYNRNYHITSFISYPVYMVFENYNNETYSIFLQRIVPFDTTLITIVSDTIPHINPIILDINDTNKIIWQSKIDGYWQLFSKEYTENILSPIRQLTEDSVHNTEPSLNWDRQLFWIKDSNLYVGNFTDTLSDIIKIDSDICSNPSTLLASQQVLYESQQDSIIIIKEARYSSSKSSWEKSIVSDSSNNSNPRYGGFGTHSYNKFIEGVWKAFVKTDRELWISNNETYNVFNPYYYIYPYVFKTSDNYLPFAFVVYESDSISDNKEIFIEDIFSYNEFPKKNISNHIGNDVNPYTQLLGYDTVMIFWEHQIQTGSQIWWVKEHTLVSGIDKKADNPNRFFLAQNYPNPFNPQTKIVYNLAKTSFVEIKIFDVTGREVKTLVKKEQTANQYAVTFNAAHLASGIYYYRIKAGDFVQTKKMVLLR